MDGNRFPQLSVWKVKSIIWNNTHNIYIHPCMCLRSDYTHQYFKGCNNHLYMLWIYLAVSYLDIRPAASLITMIVIQCLTLCVIWRLLHIISPIYIIVPTDMERWCFATDCPCGVWCRGLTTCILHVGPPFGNRILNNSWAVGLT